MSGSQLFQLIKIWESKLWKKLMSSVIIGLQCEQRTTMVDKIPWDTCVVAFIFCVLKTEF